MTQSLRLLVLVLTLFSSQIAFGQRDPDYFQEPKVPSAESLDRLNLKLGWYTFVPLGDRFDRVALVQVLGDQLFVQTYSGKIFALSASTGEVMWTYTFSSSVRTIYRLGYNPTTVFVVNGLKLIALDRKDGKTVMEQPLPATAASGPVADLKNVFVALSNTKLVGYLHSDLIFPDKVPPPPPPEEPYQGISRNPPAFEPLSTKEQPTPSVAVLNSLKPPFELPGRDAIISVSVLPSLRPPYRIDSGRTPSLGIAFPLTELGNLSEFYVRQISPKKLFDVQLFRSVVFPPVMTKNTLLLSTLDRLALGVSKDSGRVTYEFNPDSQIVAPMSQVESTGYITTADSSLFSLDLDRGSTNWRYSGGIRANRKPFVTDDSIYIGGEGGGITRVDRERGDKLWFHPTADQILAMNPKYIYASDRFGKLHVLERRRGLSLSTFDISTFSMSVLNEQNDRIYLVGRNGLMIALHDKEYRTPVLPLTPPKKVEPKKEEPKVEEPKKEEPKKEAPKKVDPKKVDPKKVDPKKEEDKKEDAKKE